MILGILALMCPNYVSIWRDAWALVDRFLHRETKQSAFKKMLSHSLEFDAMPCSKRIRAP